MNTRFAISVLLISSVGWGLTWLPIKAMNEMGLDSMQLIFIAFLSATLLLLPWLYKQYPAWKGRIYIMLMIGLCGGIANAAFQTAIFHGEVIRVMILFYLLPVWSVLGGKLFLKEKIDAVRLFAVVVCLTGAFVILEVWNTSWQGFSWIDLVAISSGMALAATNILFRFSQDIPLVSKVSTMFMGCTVIIGVSMLVMPMNQAIPGYGVMFLAAAYGAIWLTVITLGTQWGVTQLEAGRSSIIIVMELVVAVVSVAVLTSAELKLYEFIGGLMVISAAVLETSRSDDSLIDCPVTDESAN